MCHKKKIDTLFDKSNAGNLSFAKYPIRVVLQEATGESTTQVLFSVPKRSFRKAVDRNCIKRRMREAYRLNKRLISPQKFYLAFLYTARERLSYMEIEVAMKKILQQLAEKNAS